MAGSVSLGKAYVEIHADAARVGPETEAELTAALTALARTADVKLQGIADDAGDAAGEMSESMRDAARDVDRVLSQVDDGGSLDRLAGAAETAGRKVSESLGEAGRRGGREMGENADREGSALVGKVKDIAVAAAAAFGAAFVVDQYMQLDSATATLEATLGASSARAAELGQVAAHVYGQAWGENLGEVSAAVDAVVSSIGGMRDASTTDIEGLTTTALAFAQAFGTDVAESAQTAGQLISNGLAKDGTQAFDLLTSAFQRVPAAMREELPAILNEYGTNFRALGFTGEQAFGILAGAADGGAIVLDKMGDALKELTINSIDLGKNGELYKQLGLDAEEMANGIASGGPKAQAAAQQIADAILGIEDPAARANAAISFFGTPLEDLSVDQIPTFLKSITGVGDGMTDAAGSAEQLTDALGDTMQGKVDALKRGVSEFAVNSLGSLIQGFQDGEGSGEGLTLVLTTIGAGVAGLVGWVRDSLIPVLQGMAEWIGENKTVIGIIAGVIALVFIPHLIALAWQAGVTKVQVAASWAAQKAQAVIAAAAHSLSIAKMIGGWLLMGAQAVIQGVKIAAVWTAQIVASAATGAASFAIQVARVVGGWVLMGAQSLIQAARMAAAWVIAMGPVGWIIAAVIGLVALIIANWETVKNFTVGVFTAIWGFIKGVWDWIVGAISGALSWIWNLIQTAWNAYLTIITTVLGFIWDVISGVFNAVWGFISGIWNGIVDFIKGAWDGIGNAIRGALDWIWGIVTGAFTKVRDFIGGVFSGIASTVGAIWDGIGGAIKGAINGIIGTINDFVIGGVNVLIDGVNLVNPFKDIPHIPGIPLLAEGGIITRPTLAMVGEAGDEAVVPLSRRYRPQREAIMAAAGLTGGGGEGETWHVDVQQTYVQQPGQSGEELMAIGGQRFVRDLRNGVTSARLGAVA